MAFIRTSASVLLTGYILTFFSEWMFWSGRPLEPGFLVNALPTWLLYSFITFLFLAAIQFFRVRTIWAVFLAGGVYGWLLEGVIVQTTYDNFPINISFTALAWHALISVLVGWRALPRLMRNGGKGLLITCAALGLSLGLWSVGWWSETSPAPPQDIFLYNVVFALGLVGAYIGQSRLTFQPNRYAIYAAIALLAVYFVFVTVPTQPLALLVMPLLLAVTLITLRKNRRDEPEAIPQPEDPLPLRRTLPLLLIPLVASLFYGLALTMGLSLPGLQIAYILLMPAGFIVFFVSLYKIWKRPAIGLLVG